MGKGKGRGEGRGGGGRRNGEGGGERWEEVGGGGTEKWEGGGGGRVMLIRIVREQVREQAKPLCQRQHYKCQLTLLHKQLAFACAKVQANTISEF